MPGFSCRLLAPDRADHVGNLQLEPPAADRVPMLTATTGAAGMPWVVAASDAGRVKAHAAMSDGEGGAHTAGI